MSDRNEEANDPSNCAHTAAHYTKPGMMQCDLCGMEGLAEEFPVTAWLKRADGTISEAGFQYTRLLQGSVVAEEDTVSAVDMLRTAAKLGLMSFFSQGRLTRTETAELMELANKITVSE